MKYHQTSIPLSLNEIESLISQFKNDNNDGGIDSGNLSEKELYKIRRSKVLIFNEFEFSVLHEKIKDFVLKVAENIFGEFNIFELTLQVTEYDHSYKGFYDWHRDARSNQDVTPHQDDTPEGNRILSFSVLLNDSKEYEGGKFEIRDIELKNFTKQTDMIMFYSNLVHRVSPVTEGTRYSLVGWLSGVRQNNE